ncbi:MAG: hypothetical protein IT249_01245 [Chitinophagaceae bacterium]|nr:hypothetical protein [Chitinophagaceae bacterium]
MNTDLLLIKHEIPKFYPNYIHPLDERYESTQEYKQRVQRISSEGKNTNEIYQYFLQELKRNYPVLVSDFSMIPFLHRCRTFIVKESFSSNEAHVFHISLLMPYYIYYSATLNTTKGDALSSLPGCIDFTDKRIVADLTMDHIGKTLESIFKVKKLDYTLIDERFYEYACDGDLVSYTFFYGLFLDDYLMHSF